MTFPDGILFISLGSRDVRRGTQHFALSHREAELLLAIALATSPRDRSTLAAMIWPDLDEKGGRNAVGVYVARLRKRFAGLDAIESQRTGYVLRHPFDVDVLFLERALAADAVLDPLPAELEALVAQHHQRLPQWVLLSDWLAPYARRLHDAIRQTRLRRAEAAEARGARDEAQRYRSLLNAEDP